MLNREAKDAVEIACPECGSVVKTTTKDAEKGKLRCPRGHEFAVMGVLGGGGLGGPGDAGGS